MIRVNTGKVCPVCKEFFTRPTGKSDKVWQKQVCCGVDCAAIYRRIDKPQRPRRADLIPGKRRYAGWRKETND